MGFTDFVKGAVEAAHGKHGFIDTAADAITEPAEWGGKGLHAIGTGINATADRAGDLGDVVQKGLNAVHVPKPIGSVANFALGGEAQWVGRSFGDLGQGVGTIMQHEDDALKGAHHLGQFIRENPKGAELAVGAGLTWAANNKMKIAKGAGKAALDTATDPATLILAAGTGGASVGLGLAEGATAAGTTAAADALVEGGTLAAARAATGAAARQVATNIGERAATGLAAEGIEAGEATAAQTAKAFAKQTIRQTFTGANTPENAAERAAQRLSRNPGNRLAQARQGVADSLAEWGSKGGLGRQVIAERGAGMIEPGTTMPSWGGPAAKNEWLYGKAATNANRVGAATRGIETGAEIAADPTGYALEKIGSMESSAARVRPPNVTDSVGPDLIQPSVYKRAEVNASYTSGRGFKGPSVKPAYGQRELTGSESVGFKPVNDPYAVGTAYGNMETNVPIEYDPYGVKQRQNQQGQFNHYDPLAEPQPVEDRYQVAKPDKKTGVYSS